MANFDDLLEHRHRLKFGLALAPFLGLGSWYWALHQQVGDPTRLALWENPASWVSLSPFVLGWFALIYRFVPFLNGRIGTAGQGAKPRLWRQGNPTIRQPSGAGSWLVALGLLSIMGCIGMAVTGESLTLTAFPMMYVSLALVFFLIMAQVRWIELDIDSLRIIRHRVCYGLQISAVQPEKEAVRALGVCRGSYAGPFKVFAFCKDGSAIPLSQEYTDLKQISFESERLADQLMVPLLRNMENQSPETVARHVRSLSDDKLPVRQDWGVVTMPEGLQAHRSIYPPVD
ncbi:MAG: hypothetical protein KF760_19600 [Candidatus Eremiobacteraeota bacterium]|nr:hypothetical protein [Candidatus Eremiobacteraeota bacterium]MCW5868777.1 hypothetical protein [Candidatus Eremiobacteraeota bacterium]